jgi:ribosome-associated toxin RatA of RatAB toxin-antitoxin module
MINTIHAVEKLKGNCRKKNAWSFLLDYSNYQKIIPQIDTIHIHERKNNFFRTEWFIMLDGAPFSWIELDLLQQDRYLLHSEAVNGDFDTLRGRWKIEDSNQGSINLSYSLEYALGIPVIEENLGDILKEKMQKYVASLVDCQSKRITESAFDERRFKRIKLHRNRSFKVNGRTIEATIINFSRGGIKLALKKGMLEIDSQKEIIFQFSDVIASGYLQFDSYYQDYRIVFSKPINESDFKTLFTDWAEGITFSEDLVKIYEVVTSKQSGVYHPSLKVPV